MQCKSADWHDAKQQNVLWMFPCYKVLKTWTVLQQEFESSRLSDGHRFWHGFSEEGQWLTALLPSHLLVEE